MSDPAQAQPQVTLADIITKIDTKLGRNMVKCQEMYEDMQEVKNLIMNVLNQLNTMISQKDTRIKELEALVPKVETTTA